MSLGNSSGDDKTGKQIIIIRCDQPQNRDEQGTAGLQKREDH